MLLLLLIYRNHWPYSIATSLMDQYVQSNGAYGDMDLSGMDKNRQWFQEVIRPQALVNVGQPVVKLKVGMPQDEAGKMQVAQLAREPGVDGRPLYPDVHILESILEQEDIGLIKNQINEQMAESLLPAAKLLEIMKSCIEREDFEMFQLYATEFMKLQMVPTPSPQNGAAPGSGGDKNQSRQNGVSPTALPSGGAQGNAPYGPGGPQPSASAQPATKKTKTREG